MFTVLLPPGDNPIPIKKYIIYHSIKVLGVIFGPTIPQNMKYSCTGVIHAVWAKAGKAYTRSLSFAQRGRYVKLCLFANILYTHMAQIACLSTAHAQQITTNAIDLYGRGYISDTRDEDSTSKEGRRLWFPKYRWQMQDAAVQSGPDVGGKVRNSTIEADAQFGPHSHSGEPS